MKTYTREQLIKAQQECIKTTKRIRMISKKTEEENWDDIETAEMQIDYLLSKVKEDKKIPEVDLIKTEIID